jgi:hypothetical protein
MCCLVRDIAQIVGRRLMSMEQRWGGMLISEEEIKEIAENPVPVPLSAPLIS